MIKHEMTFTKKKPNSWATYFFMLLTPQLAYLTETSISRRNYLYYNSVCNIFFRKECSSPPYLGGGVVLSEFGGIQLEFRYLSHILNDPVYFEKMLKIQEAMEQIQPQSGLFPVNIHPFTGLFTTGN
jgi:hypothetical protein